MHSPTSLTRATFDALTPTEAVEAFRSLLCAEAARLGIPVAAINVPQTVTVADGGIDATVQVTSAIPKGGLITNNHSRFQIKTGDSFKPWQESAIKSELYGSAEAQPANKSHLRSAVRTCMDAGGQYVLVCFGHELVSPNLDIAKGLLTKELQACGYLHPDVEVLGQNHLVSLFEQHIGLVRRYGVLGYESVLDHASWSNDAEMRLSFKSGQQQDDLIKALQDALRTNDNRHIRICGEPGIGKTRLVLEAMRADDLAPHVLYGTATAIMHSDILTRLISDNRLQAILVVDECDQNTRAELVNRLAAYAPRLRVISIDQAIDTAAGINLLTPAALSDEVITAIIAGYGAPGGAAQRWARLCDGSPRVAHVIGQNFLTNPNDILQSPSSANVWHRYVEGPYEPSDPIVAQTRTVLRYLALFQRFGYEAAIGEAKAIAAMIQGADPSITWAKFQEIIQELRRRRILQGEGTLYITPMALHIWLWGEWWDTYGLGFVLDDFVKPLPGKLHEWFIEMWRYAHRSGAAIRVVTQLLSDEGPFADGSILRTEIGSRFFLALTDASPEAAIDCLERTVGAWSSDELRDFTEGRRNVIFALEKITVWDQLFVRGARILLSLAAAENEKWSNNATGVFADLFVPGYGAVASSEASPNTRFPVLVEAVSSNDPARRAVGFLAAEHALHTDDISRAVGAEYQGLKKPPKMWMPKTYGELWDTYKQVWQFLDQHLDKSTPEDQKVIAGILVKQSTGLVRYPYLAPMCLTTLRRLVDNKWIAAKTVIAILEDVIHYHQNALHPSILSAVTKLRDDLVGTGFTARLHRFVGMARLADQYDDEGHRSDEYGRILDGLAVEAMSHVPHLTAEIPWLVTDDAENARPFGYRIGALDTSNTFLEQIIAAFLSTGVGRSINFLGGYFHALRERDLQRWEQALDEWAKDEQLVRLLPELTWHSGMSDRAAMRMIDLAKRDSIDTRSFGYFRFGRSIEEISEPVLRSLIEMLLAKQTSEAALLAVELLYDYDERPKRGIGLPRELIETVITNPLLFGRTGHDHQSMAGYAWANLAASLVKSHPDAGAQLLGLILENEGERRGIFGRYDKRIEGVARQIIVRDPDSAWKVILAALDSGDDARVYHALQWLGGHGMLEDANGYWELIPISEFWAWIDKDRERRSGAAADVMPRRIDQTGPGAITRDLLSRYGDVAETQDRLIARFLSGSWMGNASDRFATMKRAAEAWLTAETNPKVVEWLQRFIHVLTSQVESWRVREERERW